MVTSQTEIKSRVIELSKESFDTFCDEISAVFGADMVCKQLAVAAETVQGLKKRFKKLVAVNSVKAEGALDGTFQLVFDQKGLFTLAGLIAMHSEQMILENIKQGSVERAGDMSDALTEAGHTLVGVWDRVFRKGLMGHGRFVQTNVFIGNPWEESEDKIGLAGDEEFAFVPYEIKVSSYPPFNCGVIFPKTIFERTSQSDTDQAVLTGEKTQDQKVAVDEADAAQKSDGEKTKAQKPTIEKAPTKQTTTEEDVEETSMAGQKAGTDKKPKPTKKKKKTTTKKVSKLKTNSGEKPGAVAEQKSNDVNADASDNVVEEKAVTIADTDKRQERPVSETIRKMAQSPAILPGEHASPATAEPVPFGAVSAVPAKDIMQKDIIWGGPDDSIQQALTKIEQHNAAYMMIGQNGVLEGIVSKSDLTGAISPYLRPVFAKWCRPLDNATLQIKIKWIMHRTVHTITPETPLAAIIENMYRFSVRCLPVADPQDKIQGLVTVFDVFRALLKYNSNISTASGDTQ